MLGRDGANTSVLTWGIRLAALAVGGSMSVVAIAALVTALPSGQTFQEKPGSARPSAMSQSHPPQDSSPPSNTSSPLPSVYPLTRPIASLPQAPVRIASDPVFLALSSPSPLLKDTDSALSPDTPPAPSTSEASPSSLSFNVPPVSDLPPSPDAPPVSDANGLPLNLQDVVILALENNREIKNAYLNRIIEQESLRVAEDVFNPNVTPRLSINARRSDQGFSTSTAGDVELATDMNVQFPNGTRLSAGWRATGNAQTTIGLNQGASDGLGQRIEVAVTQPLWRDSGETITRAPLRLARLQEDQNVFALRTTLISTITQASETYFSLVLSQQQLEIEKAGLARTETELDRIEALIAVGREAGSKRVEAEADVANRQVSVEAAEDSLRNAQLALIQALDIDQELIPIATEANALNQDRIRFDNDDALVEYALTNNPIYRSQLLESDVAAIQLLQAEDRLGWDLNLVVGYSNDLSSRSAERSDARAGLQLSRELGDRSLKQRVLAQRTQIERLENTQTERRENLEISVRDAIRNVDFQQTQVEQAQRATQLAIQQLEITQFQFRQGNETFLDVVQAQDRLVASQNQELSAQIGYQRALLRLDQVLGHTLTTWSIPVQSVDLP